MLSPFFILIKCSKTECAENKHVIWEKDRTSLPASTLCPINVALEIPPCSVEKELCHTRWIRAQHSSIDGPRDSCCPIAKSCPTLCSPMGCNTTGFHVLHYLSEFAQTHVHWVHDAIQPSHPLLTLSPPALNLSQHQGLLQWVGGQNFGASVLAMNIQDLFLLGLTGLILQSKGLSRVFSRTTVQRPQFILWCSVFLWSNSHYWKNYSFNYMDLRWQSNVSSF